MVKTYLGKSLKGWWKEKTTSKVGVTLIWDENKLMILSKLSITEREEGDK